MGEDLYEHSQAVRELFEAAQAVVDFSLTDTIFRGSEDDLKQTDVAQVAITLINMSAAAVLQERGIKPDALAGFSLGEYAALAAAGVISTEDVFRLVKARGQIMAEESAALTDEHGSPGMAAVIGIDPLKVQAALDGRSDVFAANMNSPKQTVISGTSHGLSAAKDILKEAGARRIIPLKVSGPFHSPLLEKARERMADFLDGITFSDPKIPVYSNVTASQIRTGIEARELCLRHMVSPVQWVEEQKNLLAAGMTRFVEAGPGKVLCGLLEVYVTSSGQEGISVVPAGTLEAIEQIR